MDSISLNDLIANVLVPTLVAILFLIILAVITDIFFLILRNLNDIKQYIKCKLGFVVKIEVRDRFDNRAIIFVDRQKLDSQTDPKTVIYKGFVFDDYTQIILYLDGTGHRNFRILKFHSEDFFWDPVDPKRKLEHQIIWGSIADRQSK